MIEREGPPSPEDVQSIARRLLAKEPRRAHALAEIMVDWWQPILGDNGLRAFMWWLGFGSAANVIATDREATAAARRGYRSARRAHTKPADLPVSNPRGSHG